MKLDDLIEFLYHPHPNTPRCSHCRRPLFPVEHAGEQFLYCKHCADIAEEDKLLEELNPGSTELFPFHGFNIIPK